MFSGEGGGGGGGIGYTLFAISSQLLDISSDCKMFSGEGGGAG